MPTIPKQKEKFLQELKLGGASILPKTYKQQVKEAKKILKVGQISIKITKPRLTINGFQVDKDDIEKMKQDVNSKGRKKPDGLKVKSSVSSKN